MFTIKRKVGRPPLPYKRDKNDYTLVFQRVRCQAKFRDEPFELSQEEFEDLWSNPDDWANRGRQRDNVVMVRKDINKAWSRDNIEIVTRLEQLRRSSFLRKGKKHGPRGPYKKRLTSEN